MTEANYQAAIDNVRSLKASLQDRRASYELAQKKLNDAVIRAPVAGSVSERLVQPGEFIRENTPVATIVQMNPLKLKTAIQEKNAGVIKAGQTVDFVVEAFPGRDVSRQGRLRQPGGRSGHAHLPGRSAGREPRPHAQARASSPRARS